MEKVQNHYNTPNEPILAGLAYLLGWLPALIIWLVKKDDSRFVSKHALQAALYDGFVSLAALLLLTLLVVGLAGLGFGAWLTTNITADVFQPESPLVFLVIGLALMTFSIGGLSLAAGVIFILKVIDLIAGIRVWMGGDWRPPVLRGMAKKIMQWEPKGS